MPQARPRIVVVGLGPGDPGSLTLAARRAIDAAPFRFLRTACHPSASAVGAATAFDAVYDSAESMEEVYGTIVSTLAGAARRHGSVLYAVPGSPLVAERTVELLRSDPRVEVQVVAAMSFLDLAWARLGVDPVAAGVRLVDGHRFATEAAGAAGPLLVAQCDSRLVLSDIKLAVDTDPGPAVVLQRLGLPDEAVTTVAWADLDRAVEADHLTCVWIPRLAAPVAAGAARLVELVRTLRERCPWDREQTHRSLRRHLLEEAHEVLEAIDELPVAAGWDHLEEELGDLLFQVVFHAQLAGEEGQFDFADVAGGIHDKLVARHPHVFGAPPGAGPVSVADLDRTWEQRKRVEKGRASVTDGIPGTLPALLHAAKLQSRAAGLGLGRPGDHERWSALAAGLDGLRAALADGGDAVAAGAGAGQEAAAEVGDVLFGVVSLAGQLGVDPESALRGASRRFRDRVVAVETIGRERGLDAPGLATLAPAELDGLWQEAIGRAAGA